MSDVVIVTPFFWPHIGGMEKALYRIAVALHRCGVDVSVVTSRLSPRAHNPFPVVYQGDTLQDWADSLHEEITVARAERLIFSSLGPNTAEQQLAVALTCRARGALTALRVPTSDHLARNMTPLDIVDAFEFVIANSAYSLDRSKPFFPGAEYHVIHNMILEVEHQRNLADVASPRSASVAWCGRVELRKRPMELARLLNACAEAGMTVAAQPVRAYGRDADYRAFVGSLSNRVSIAEPSPRVDDSVRRASVFLHMSGREGSPNAVLEAMDRGQGVVVSDIPECVELVAGAPQGACLVDSIEADIAIIASLVHRTESVGSRELQSAHVQNEFSEVFAGRRWSEVLQL